MFPNNLRSLIVPALVLAGLLAGFLREILFAHYFGVSSEVEILRVAIGLPTILSDSLAATFVSVFIPIILKENAGENRAQTTNMLHGAIFVSVFVFSIAWFSMPLQAVLLAPGFDPAQTEKLVLTGRVFWVLFLFLNMSLVLRARLSVEGVHWPNASAQLIRSAGVISAMLVGFWLFGDMDIVFVAIAAALAGLAVLCLHVLSVSATERKSLWRKFCAPIDVKGAKPIVAALMWMIVLQLLLSSGRIIDRSFASEFGQGRLAVLEYSYALTMAAVAAIGASANILLAPMIAKAIHSQRRITPKLRRMITVLCVLASAIGGGAAMFATPIVELVFAHGQFDAQATIVTAQIFQVQALALGPLVCSLVLLQVLVLRGLHQVVVAFAMGKFVLKAVLLSALFAGGFGFAGLVASFLLTETVSTAILILLVAYHERQAGRQVAA